MSSVIIAGDVSGTVTLQAPSAAGSTVVTLPANSMTLGNGGGSIASNTAFGTSALASNTTGSLNVAVGYQAAYSNTTGGNNIAIGYNAQYGAGDGSYNVSVGRGTIYGQASSSGSYNSALGHLALSSSTSGNYNVAVGYQAMLSNTTGTGNTALGTNSLVSNTTGTSNTAVGSIDGTANGPLYSNTSGSNNVAIGTGALRFNTTASNNVAMGYQAAYNNTNGTRNMTIGSYAGYTNSSGIDNVFIGYAAGYNSTGSSNTFIGARTPAASAAGELMTTGSKNTLIGAYDGNSKGLDIRTASNYIVLSDGDGNPRIVCTSGGSSQAYVSLGNNGAALFSSGEQFSVNGGSTLAAGFVNTSTSSTIYVKNLYQDGTSNTRDVFTVVANSGNRGTISTNGSTTTYGTTSDYRLKDDVQSMVGAIEKLALLNPVTYTWKESQLAGQGFIAHELQEVFPDAVAGEKDAVDADGNPVYQNIDQSFLVATLVKAIQELNAKVDAQAAEIAALKGQA